MKFLGHLDMMRYFQKAMRRAKVPIAFTEGYSPHMIMSFAQPLGLGVTSDGEYLDIELEKEMELEEVKQRLNQEMVEGVRILNIVPVLEGKKHSAMTLVSGASYEVFLLESEKREEPMRKFPQEWIEKVKSFLEQSEISVWKKTKTKEGWMNIRPMIYQMEIKEDKMSLFLAAGSVENLKPDLVLSSFLNYVSESAQEFSFHYRRKDLFAKENGDFFPLDHPFLYQKN